MNLDSQALEQIVAEVVRRLSQMGASPADAAPAPTPPAPAPRPAASVATPAKKPKTDTLVLDARVISTATIHNRLAGVRTVVIGPRAIVTPSARDEFDKRHIRVERTEPDSGLAGSCSLTVVRLLRSTEATRAATALHLPTDAVEHLSDDLPDAVGAASNAVTDGNRLAIIITDLAMAANCLLNRAAHVRATQVRSVEETRQAISAIGANVLVVDPRDATANRWHAIVKEFCREMPRNVPTGW